jgi:hypothetical protein
MATATRCPSSPPASTNPTAPAPVIPVITASSAPCARSASAPPAAQTTPAAPTGAAATRLAALNAAWERSVAGVRTPAKRLRGSRRRHPNHPTVINAAPASSSTIPSSVDARTAVRVAAPHPPRASPATLAA